MHHHSYRTSVSVLTALALGIFLAAACSEGTDSGVPGDTSTVTDGGSGGTTSSGGGEGGSTSSGGGQGGGTGGEGGEAPLPEQYAPCSTASCWDADGLALLCGPSIISEDFSSGLYNVHEYPLWIAEGITVELSLGVTGGSWSPALIVQDEGGFTVHDGAISYSDSALSVELIATGQGSNTATVRLTAHEQARLNVFVTAWGVIDSGFTDFIPTSATYELSAEADCEPGQLDPITPPNFDPSDTQNGYYVLPPSEPAGLYTKKQDDCSRGIERLITVLYTVAWHWHEADPSRPPIDVLDLNEAWCSSVNHETHDDGTHADIVAGCATNVSCADKSQVLELAKLFVDTGEVCGIINDNDPDVLDQVNAYFDNSFSYDPWHYTFMRSIGGHTAHFHIRVKKPDGTCN